MNIYELEARQLALTAYDWAQSDMEEDRLRLCPSPYFPDRDMRSQDCDPNVDPDPADESPF